MRTSRGPAIEPPISAEETPLLLDWRKLICTSGLHGLARELAAGSELVQLTENSVLLRPLSHTLVTESLKTLLNEAFTKAKGSDFSVVFAAGERDPKAVTVALIEEMNRRAARVALIDAFKSDPFVQECLTVLGGTVDETTVTPLKTENKE